MRDRLSIDESTTWAPPASRSGGNEAARDYGQHRLRLGRVQGRNFGCVGYRTHSTELLH